MWCVPELNREYVERMEDVLNLMEKPATETEPVVALDERPVQLHATRVATARRWPRAHRPRDYEYVRRGTANVFCIVAPKTGRHLTHATRESQGPPLRGCDEADSRRVPEGEAIHLVLDNLSTHRGKSLYRRVRRAEGRRLWRRFIVHYTPKHGSWLNPAEIEVSLWSRECLGRDRIATLVSSSTALPGTNRRPRAQENQLAIHNGMLAGLRSSRHYAWAGGLEASSRQRLLPEARAHDAIVEVGSGELIGGAAQGRQLLR